MFHLALVRNCENHVELLVCQPKLAHNACGRKSTLLSAAKRNKLKTRPIRVRFAESVCVNGAPLFPVSDDAHIYCGFRPFDSFPLTRFHLPISDTQFYLILSPT